MLRLSRTKQKPAKCRDGGGALAPEGSEAGLKRYSCWCPKVIALIGAVADTIADRVVIVGRRDDAQNDEGGVA